MDLLVKFVIAQFLLFLLFEDVATCANSLLSPEVIELESSGMIRTIDSPGWPDEYDSNELCYWRVEAPIGHTIGWRFDPEFQMQPDFRCNRDYVRLYDSFSDRTLIGKYCGLWEPSPGTTNGRFLLIKFKTDRSLQYRGFRIAVQLDTIPASVPSYSSGINATVVGILVLLVFVIVIASCICLCCCCCNCCKQGGRGVVIRNNATSSTTATPATAGAITVSQRVAPPHQTAYPQHYNPQQYGSGQNTNFSPAQPPYPVHPAYPPTDPHAPPSYATPSAPPPSYSSLFDK